MKSTILIVLLAVCHITSAKPQDLTPRVDRDVVPDAEPVYTVPSVIHDTSKVVESHSSGDGSSEYCDCDKLKLKLKPKITYGPEQIVKGKPETYIHHQPKIIVRQPPTHVRIEHPPTVIQPSTIVIRRHGKTIRRPVIYRHLPQDVQVRPIYIKVVKPIEKKIIIEKKSHHAAIVNGHGHNANLEYETSHGGRTYSGSFDEHQQEDIDIQKSKQVEALVHSSEYGNLHDGGRSYSGSYAEQQQEAIDIQKSKQVQAQVDSTEYDNLYGGGVSSYSGSYDEQQQESVDIQKSKQVQAQVDSTEYGNLYGGGVSGYSGSYDEQQQESVEIEKSKQGHALVESNEYGNLYDGTPYRGSFEEEQEAIDIQE